MEAKWKKMGLLGNLPYLIVESGPSIKQLYFQSKHLLQGRGILIVGIDGPSLLGGKDKKIFSNQLEAVGIPYQMVGPFLWIQAEEVGNLFAKSDFGSSAETFLIMKHKPNKFELRKIPRISGLFRKGFPKEIVNIFDNYSGSNIVYVTNDVPDLLIVSKEKEFLEHVYRLIEIVG